MASWTWVRSRPRRMIGALVILASTAGLLVGHWAGDRTDWVAPESCSWTGEFLTIRFTYGILDRRVMPGFEQFDDHIEVGVALETEPGTAPAIGYAGEATFFTGRGRLEVRAPDGKVMDCPEVPAAPVVQPTP